MIANLSLSHRGVPNPRASTFRAREARGRQRTGGVILLSVFLLVVLLVMAAFAVDFGTVMLARTQLQRTADASASAAAWQLMDGKLYGEGFEKISETAARYARENVVGSVAPKIAGNPSNAEHGDLVVGRIVYPRTSYNEPMTPSPAATANAVFVRVRRARGLNGQLPLHLGQYFDRPGISLHARAAASFRQSFRGFRIPEDEGPDATIPILPFALDASVWNQLVAGQMGNDNWSYNRTTGALVAGSDGLREVRIYPTDVGSSATRGAIDVGTISSTPTVQTRQVRYGVTRQDLAFHGGKLELNSRGQLVLSGTTGARYRPLEDAFQEIIGQTRILPLFRTVQGSGTDARYTITGFVGVRVVEVRLLGGGEKRVFVQAANVVTRGGIDARPGESFSRFIYSPVALIQ
jgi:hypothetical protein